MKRTIILLLMLVVLLPSQALAASVSTSYIEKTYFENYKSRVQEVRTAQKNLSTVLGTEVSTLTEKSKTYVAKYNSVVKSKSSKETVATAKSERDQVKKQLAAAKVKLAAEVKAAKQESESALKNIATYKKELVGIIKLHLEGKDKQSDATFSKSVYGGLTYIDSSFTAILENLSNI